MVDFNPEPNGKPKPGGRGADSHLSPVQENKIIGMMLNPRRRWKLTQAAKNEAISVTLNNMGDEDGRVRNAAVANMIRMEGQNQAEAHAAMKQESGSQHVENQQINIYLPNNARGDDPPAIPHLNGEPLNGLNGHSH